MKKLTSTLAILAAVCAAQPAVAFTKGDIIARVGAANVDPSDSSSNIFVGAADLGFGLTVEDNTQLGLNFAYFLSDKLNIEVLAATPFTHDVNFGASNPLSTGNLLGEVTHLPPTVTLNYYLNDPDSAFQPYIGLGLNYTFIFDEEFSAANEAIGLSDLSLDDSFGLAAQIGLDYMLNEKWFLNGSIRWVDIDTEATFDLNGTEGSVSSIEIDPTVTMLSLGYRY
ncbi:MAG: outer membrane protein [Arenicella sp.]|jgi:outer membrane protein